MDDQNYSFRDADRALVRIFSYLKEQKESKGPLAAEAEFVVKILEGFLTAHDSESEHREKSSRETGTTFSAFELHIPTEEFDPQRLFDRKK